MPRRIQVNLPDDLAQEVDARGLDVDELLADAVRQAMDRLHREAVNQAALDELIAEGREKYGSSLTEEEAWAKALSDRARAHLSKNNRAS